MVRALRMWGAAAPACLMGAGLAMAQDDAIPALTPPWFDAPAAVRLEPPRLVDHDSALNCLTSAVYYEAATEPLAGRQAVAQVVLNRLGSPGFPKSVCGVVYQGAERTTGCQFSFACDGSQARRPVPRLWSEAETVAEAALGGHVDADIAGATHYHADYVSPSWRWSLVETRRIGQHVFYRPPVPGEAPARSAPQPRGGLQRRRPAPSGPVDFSVWGLDVAQVSARSDGLHIDPPKGPL